MDRSLVSQLGKLLLIVCFFWGLFLIRSLFLNNENNQSGQPDRRITGKGFRHVSQTDSIECGNDQIDPIADQKIATVFQRFIEDINIGGLMEDPTPEEIRLALNDVKRRDRSVQGLIEEDTFTVFLGEYLGMARIVSHVVDNNRHYGGIIVPETDQMEKLPVLIYLEGFDQQFPAVWINQKNLLLKQVNERYWHKFVIVIPSFRGQTLYFNDSSGNISQYKSEGERNDAFDGAAEDALGLLNVAFETTENVDKDRIMVVGYSRGGTVGLLMAQRDPSIKWVLNTVGPLDFGASTLFQRTFDIKLLEEGIKSDYKIPTNLGEQYVYFFLEKMKKGQASLETVRKRIILSSPYYFTSRLSNTKIQMHYGTEDISFIQLQRFHAQMEDLGLSCPQYEVYVHANRGHDLIGDKPVEQSIEKFVNTLLEKK